MNITRIEGRKLKWAEEGDRVLKPTMVNLGELCNFLDVDAREKLGYEVTAHRDLAKLMEAHLANFNSLLIMFDIMEKGGLHCLISGSDLG